MDLTKYEAIQKEMEEKSQYFARLDFSELSISFMSASKALQELVEALKNEFSKQVVTNVEGASADSAHDATTSAANNVEKEGNE